MRPDHGDASRAAHAARALEALPAIVWSFAGSQHVIVAANRAARASVGDRPDIVGRPVREVLPEVAGQHIFELLDQVYRTGLPAAARERRVVLGAGSNGTEREGFFSFTALPLPASGDAEAGVLVHAIDVTEAVRLRQQAQRGMRQFEQRYADERDVALTLQRSLLPATLPVLPWLRPAARYLAAGELLAGGDWFDAVVLPGGSLIASIGDVVGHGAAATAVMGQLRSALNAAVLAGATPDQAVTNLDRFAATVDGAAGSTACLVELQPNGQLCWLSAGHPAPLLAGRDGVRFLELTPGPPLGTGAPKRSVHEAWLEPGDTLLLYTDGAIDRPEERPDTSRRRLITELRAALAREQGTDQACARVLAGLASSGPRTDDVALLMLQRPAEVAAPLRLDLPAEPTQLAVLRRHLGDWLDAVGVPAEDAMLVQLAAGEAAANAVEHAYLDRAAGRLRIDGGLGADGVLELTVADQGRWRRPAPDAGARGRGLFLIRETMDEVRLRQQDGGTTVVLRRRLRQPTADRQAGAPEAPPGWTAGQWTVRTDEVGVTVAVTGTVDTGSAGRFGRDLLAASRGGTLPTTVDLTGLDQLTSAGMRQLFELAAQCHDGGGPLRVIVAPGSVAELVLDLTHFGAEAELVRRTAEHAE